MRRERLEAPFLFRLGLVSGGLAVGATIALLLASG
jgi:hypothetical protein